MHSGQLQSTLGLVKEAQIRPYQEEQRDGIGRQLVPLLGPHLDLERLRHTLDRDRPLNLSS